MAASVKLTEIIFGILGNAANRFKWTVGNETGGIKLLRDSGQEIISVDTAGIVKMPQNDKLKFEARAASQTVGWGIMNFFGSWTAVDNPNSFGFAVGFGSVMPNVAGFYAVLGEVSYGNTGFNADTVGVGLIKNNATVFGECGMTFGTTSFPAFQVSGFVYLNGTTDFVQVYTRKISAPNAPNVTAKITLVRIGG